jgi:zinc protease
MRFMIFKRLASLLLVVAIACTFAAPVLARNAPAPVAGVPAPSRAPANAVWPWEGSDLKTDPAVVYGQLPNGLRYAIRPNKLPEGSVVLRFRIKAGSRYERDDQQGFSHFIEHMAFNGSTNIPEGELTKTMERLGSSFGSDVNAHVNLDEVMYKLDLPRADEGRLETALKIFRETGDRLLFDEAAIKREMGVVLSELNDGDTPFRRVSRRTSAFTRPDDIATKRPPIGERSVIESANSAKLRAFYDMWYRPDRAILVISGDVDVEATKAFIAAQFSDWTPKTSAKPPEPDDGKWPQAQLRALIQVEPDLPSVVSVAAMRPDEFDYGELDRSDWRKWWLLNTLASDIFERRLATMQLVDNPPATGVGFDQSSGDNGWTATLWVTPRDQDWQRGLTASVIELRQAIEGGFNAAEIAEAIKERRLGYDRSIAEASTRRTVSLAGSVMSALAEDSVYMTPEDRKKLFEEVVPTATPEALKAAFAWWWQGVEPALVLMRKTPLPGGEEALKAAWRAAWQAPLPARAAYVRAQYTPIDIGPPGQVVTTQVRHDPDATIARFANGVTLAFKQTQFTAGRVNVSVNFGAGSLAFPLDDQYWTSFASSAWNGDGVGQLTRDQMITALAGRTTSLASASVGTASSGLAASVATADLVEQLQVMLSQVQEPRLGPRATTLLRDQLRTSWDSIALTPSSVFGLNASSFFYRGLPSFEVPSLESYLASDETIARSRLRTILAQAPMNITIVGDTTLEAAQSAVARTFGALPARTGLTPGFDQLRAWQNVAPGGPPRILRHKGTQNQAILHVTWATPGVRRVQMSNDLYVLGQILQLRLTAKVREAAGESYSPDGGWTGETLVDKGRLYAHASIAPTHIDQVNAMIDEIARDLGTQGPTADELQRVVGPLLESRARSRQTNGYWSGLLMSMGLPKAPGAQTGDPLELQKRVEQRVRSITPAKLRQLAARYMVPSNAIRVQVLPEAVAPVSSTPAPIG